MIPENEKSKIDYQYQLEIRKIFYDKVVLGALITIFALLSTLYIEKYKSDQTEQQFLLEKKLEALKSIGKSYNEMMVAFYNLSDPQKQILIPNENYEAKIDDFNNAIGEWDSILSENFIEQSKFHLYIYLGLNYLKNDDGEFIKDKQKYKKYREFVSEHLLPSFTKMQKNELYNKSHANPSGFNLKKVSYREIELIGANEYAKQQLTAWNNWRQKHKMHPSKAN